MMGENGVCCSNHLRLTFGSDLFVQPIFVYSSCRISDEEIIGDSITISLIAFLKLK